MEETGSGEIVTDYDKGEGGSKFFWIDPNTKHDSYWAKLWWNSLSHFVIPTSNENILFVHQGKIRGKAIKHSFYSSWITLDFVF